MEDAIVIPHNGKSYVRRMARVVREVQCDLEDHGLILVTLHLSYGEIGGEQSITPCFSPKHRENLANAMHLFLFLRRFRKGWTGYTLVEAGFIRGLQYLEIDGGKIVMLDDIIAECEALPS